jgi:hypothetical protein
LYIFFVNKISFVAGESDDHPRPPHHIFQPQICVVCKAGTHVIPVEGTEHERDQDRELSFLYRKNPVLA